MSDRQALIDWLRHWKHEVPTTREREEMIEAMRDAATALEEAQGVPTHTRDWNEDASHENGWYQNQCVSCGEFFMGHKRRIACKSCVAAHSDAAPAAPTGAERFIAAQKPLDIPLPAARSELYDAAPAAPTREPTVCAHDWREMRSGTDPYRDDECRFCGIARAEADEDTREPVSAATPRDEQDARRYRWWRAHAFDESQRNSHFVLANARDPDELDAAIDAALAEPKR